MLLFASPTRTEPFNTNINTNYNNNYNTNLNTSYLISSLLNYILNLLQILQKNGLISGSGDSNIPSLTQPHEFQEVLRQYPPTAGQKSLTPSTKDANSPVSNTFKGDFNALYDFVFDHIVKKLPRNQSKEDGSDASETGVPYDYEKAIEDAIDAFKGPAVPPNVSLIPLNPWDVPQQVQDPPELQIAKMDFLRAFAEAQARVAKTG